jgi:hypothetical protein
MKKLIVAILTVGLLASLVQASITGAVVVSPRNITTRLDGTTPWYVVSGYGANDWRDRPGYMSITGITPTDTFMAQSGYGPEVRTTVTGLTPGRAYNFWLLFSVQLNATTGQDIKNNNIMAAFGTNTLTAYGYASPWPSSTLLANTANTGLVSRSETNPWTVLEAYMGSAVADGSGNVVMRVDYPDGSDRTLWNAIAYTSLDIVYNSPSRNAINLPIALSDPANDLVFTVDSGATLTAVDVYMGTLTDPNLTDPNMASTFKIVDKMAITPGQYTIDLVGELPTDLAYDTTYYWKVVGYEPNSVTHALQVKFVGPVSNFKTAPANPVVTIAPTRLGAFSGEAVTLTATAASYNTLQWYKDGVILSNGSKYSGVSTLTLQISNFQAGDAGNYSCVATKTSTGISTTSNLAYIYLKKAIAHWNFESTYTVGSDSFAPDIVGGRDAQLMYGATVVTGTGPDSVIGGYLNLSNPTYVESRSNPTLGQWALINSDANLISQKTLTIGVWFRPTASQSTDSRIIEFGRSSSNWLGMLTTNSSNQPGFTIDANSVSTALRSSKSITFGGWHYLVATVDSTVTTNQAKLYLDGNLVREAAWTGVIETMLPSTHCLGRSSVASSVGFYNGQIDELKIYNYVLSLTDIRREYLTGAPYICDSATYPNISAYDFDGNCQISFGDFAVLAQYWLNHARITSIP